MKQVVNSVFHILRRHAGSDLPLTKTSDLILMALLQPFHRIIHLLVPADLSIQLQAVPGRTVQAPVASRFDFFVFFQMGDTLFDSLLYALQFLPLLPHLLLLLLQHGKSAFHVLAVQILSNLFHRKTQHEQIPDDVQPVNVLQGIQPVIVLSPPGRQRSDFLIIAQGIDADSVQTGNLTDGVIFFHFRDVLLLLPPGAMHDSGSGTGRRYTVFLMPY